MSSNTYSLSSLEESHSARTSFSNITAVGGNRMDKRTNNSNYPGLFGANFWINQRRSISTIETSQINLPKVDTDLQNKFLNLIKQGQWPMNDKELNKSAENYLNNFQREIALIAAKQGTITQNLRYKLGEITTSLVLRLIAIDKLLKNPGSKTPGIDKIALDGKNREEIAFYLLDELTFVKLKHYKCKPIRRVKIKQTKGDGSIKIRPLGIPTLRDRAVQKLFTLVLDPAIDAISDPNSYGFRRFRNCHNAIGKIAVTLQKNPHNRIVLDLDIKGFFDNINHQWIRNNFPMPQGFEHILDSWLSARILDRTIFYQSEYGVPQGGIISPLIANFTLNGLESAFEKGSINYVQVKDPLTNIKKTFEIKQNLIRYADDFVIIINHDRNLELIQNNIQHFLKERGLELNEQKSNIIRMSKEGASFDFLGYTFIRFTNTKISAFNNRRDIKTNKLTIKPSRDKVISFKRKLNKIFSKSRNLTSIELVSLLNPLLRGWSYYYGLGFSAKILSQIDNYIYRKTQQWLKRKYNKTSIIKLNQTYYTTKKTKTKEIYIKNLVPNLEAPSSPYGRSWHFHATINNNKRFKYKFLVIMSLIHKRIACPRLAFNPKILKVSPYINSEPYIDLKRRVTILRIRDDAMI